MKHLIKTLLVAFLCLPLMTSAATRDEAKALAMKAASYIEQNGIEAAQAAFEKKDGEFISGELYVFVQAMDGKMLVHGANPKLDGKDLNKLKDPKGRYFVQDMIKVVKADGKGWVNYMWKHPQTGKLTPKASYVQKVNDFDGFVGCGIFE